MDINNELKQSGFRNLDLSIKYKHMATYKFMFSILPLIWVFVLNEILHSGEVEQMISIGIVITILLTAICEITGYDLIATSIIKMEEEKFDATIKDDDKKEDT